MNNYLSGEIKNLSNLNQNDQYSPVPFVAQISADKSEDNSIGKNNINAKIIPENQSIDSKNTDSLPETKDIKTGTIHRESDALKSNKDTKEESAEKIVKPAEVQKPVVKGETIKQTFIQPDPKNNKINPAVKQPNIYEIKIPGNGLLEIENEDYKYKRIPGITIIKEKSVSENIADTKNSDLQEIAVKENEKGLFGLKKSTSDILVKIIFIVIIVGIVVLFKLRSKTRADKKVLRRFPGA